jgi:hypothetical protein
MKIVAAIGLIALLVLGCDEPSPTRAPEQLAPPQAQASEWVSQEERQRLLALGYLDFAAEVSTAEAGGTVRHDPQRSHPGYNLYTSRTLRLTELVDAGGRVIQSWRGDGPGVWVRSVLLPDGDLLVVEISRVGGPHYLMRLTWQGEVAWRRRMPAHHDVVPLADGRLLVLAMRTRSLPALHPDRPIRDDELSILSSQGEILDTHSLYDVLSKGRSLNPAREPIGDTATGDSAEIPIDYFHANAIRWLDDAELASRHPLYSRRNVIVTIRNLDRVVIFDWDRAELVWMWGPGELSGPHDASVLPNGNILIFDNGVQRKPQASRVVELNPLSGDIEWEYRAPTPGDFFTLSRGASQRLANGNTLITESDSGRAFEVTPNGDIVWEYLNPHLDAKRRRATIIRLYRYEEDFVHAILSHFGDS